MRRSALVAAVATTALALSGCGTAQPTPSELASASAQASANQIDLLMPRARAKAQEVAATAKGCIEDPNGDKPGAEPMHALLCANAHLGAFGTPECWNVSVDIDSCARALIRSGDIK